MSPSPEKKKESDSTIRTTASMEARANVVKRCLISVMKMFRMCKRTKAK